MNRRLLSTTVSLSALTAALSVWASPAPLRAAAPRPALPPIAVLGVAAQSADPESVYNQGVESYNAKNFDAAIQQFTRAIELRKGKFSDASFNRGLAYQEKKEWDKAVADFTAVIAAKPRMADAYLERGRSYTGKGNAQAALADFAKAIELKPNDAEAYMLRGDAQYSAKQYDAAIADYTAYASRAGQSVDPAVYFNRGLAHSAKGSQDAAIADYNKYLLSVKAGDPAAAEAYVSRADAYMIKKDYKSAIGDYSKHLALKPNDTYSLGQRALAYLQSGDYKSSVADYTAYLRQKPGDPVALQNKIVAQSKAGDTASAVADITALLNKNPNNVPMRKQRAAAYFQAKNYNGAIADYTAILATNAGDTESLYNRAVSYGLTDKSDLAVADLTAYLRAKPDDAAAYNARAVAYTKLNKWDLAAKDFAAYAQRKPEDAEGQLNLGIALYNTQDKNNFREVDRVLTAYEAKKPGNPQVAKILADVQIALGNATGAIDRYKRALAANPNDANTAYNLGVAYMTAKQYQPAAETFTKVLTIKANDPQALQNRATAYYEMGRAGNAAAFDKAVADATTLIGLNGSNGDAILLRADANYSAKKYPAAGADYEKAATLVTDKKYATGQAVASYINAKDFPGVIRAATAAINADGSEATNYNYRGMAYIQTKNYDGAIADLSKYTGMKGNDHTAFYNLGMAYSGKGDAANAAANFEKAVSIKSDYYEAANQAALSYKKQADANSTDTGKANPLYDKAISLYDRAATIGATGKRAADAYYNKAVAQEAKAKANDNDTPMFKQAIETWNRYLAVAPTTDPELPTIRKHIEDLKAQVAREG